MVKKMLLFVVAALLLSAGITAAMVDIAGTWEMTMQSPRGERVSEMTIAQEGDEMTGEGTVKGNDVSWEVTMEGPNGEMTMTYSGTIDRNSMSGTMEMGGGMGMGPMEWTAEKK